MALNTCEMRSNAIKIAFFQKITKTSPAAGGYAPRPSSVKRLSYINLLYTPTTLDIFAVYILI